MYRQTAGWTKVKLYVPKLSMQKHKKAYDNHNLQDHVKIHVNMGLIYL